MKELEFDLVPSLAWTELVTEESEREAHLGEVDQIDRWFAKYRVFLGEAPIAVPADFAATKLGVNLEPWARLRRAGLRSWFIRNTFSLMNVGALVEPDAIGLELEFRDDQSALNPGRRIHVHSLLPGPEFRELASLGGAAAVDSKGSFVCQAAMATTGQLSEEIPSQPGGEIPLVAEGSLRAEAKVGGEIAVRISVFTTRVAAVGTGDRRAQWEFRKQKEPVVGRDIETWTGLLLSAKSAALTYRGRVYAIFGGGPFRVTHRTGWTDLTCTLT